MQFLNDIIKSRHGFKTTQKFHKFLIKIKFMKFFAISNQAIYDIVYSIYSYEEIKSSKEIINNILDKQIVTRRDPDRKKKECYGQLC